jgi:membrane-associated protease RseP (regulator of RpoE activity)
MTPQDDDVDPADEHRVMWRYPVWKRTIVMSAGSITHFLLGIVIFWSVFAFLPLNDWDKTNNSAPVVNTVVPCVTVDWALDPETGQQATCTEATGPASAATVLGLRAGDKILAINGTATASWDAMTELVRDSGGKEVTVTYERDGQTITSPPVAIPLTERVRMDRLDVPAAKITDADLERVGQIGISPVPAKTVYGPIAAFGLAKDQTVFMVTGTFEAMKKVPEKIPKLWHAVTGSERDPETPVSMIGASRLGGELFDRGDTARFLFLLAALNFFVGFFNLLPLLPLDGGHIAIAWFERARSWLYARLRRPEPGRVDYMKLMPITYVVIVIFGGFTLLAAAADIVNPITLPK